MKRAGRTPRARAKAKGRTKGEAAELQERLAETMSDYMESVDALGKALDDGDIDTARGLYQSHRRGIEKLEQFLSAFLAGKR